MKAICKIDYGQFEYNKTYNYSYTYINNMKKFYVIGQYSNTEFTKRQFDAIFTSESLVKNKNGLYNC